MNNFGKIVTNVYIIYMGYLYWKLFYTEREFDDSAVSVPIL